jgi:transposase-like protein
VRWYPTYRPSFRDLVAMMAERSIRVSHSTILRWVFRYVPEYERRFNQRSRRVASSWRVDETYIRVGAEMMYLYRGVDKHGKAVASLLSPTRSMEAGMEFFRRAAAAVAPRLP